MEIIESKEFQFHSEMQNAKCDNNMMFFKCDHKVERLFIVATFKMNDIK